MKLHYVGFLAGKGFNLPICQFWFSYVLLVIWKKTWGKHCSVNVKPQFANWNLQLARVWLFNGMFTRMWTTVFWFMPTSENIFGSEWILGQFWEIWNWEFWGILGILCCGPMKNYVFIAFAWRRSVEYNWVSTLTNVASFCLQANPTHHSWKPGTSCYVEFFCKLE